MGKTPPTDPLTPAERRVMIRVIAIGAAVVAAGVVAWAVAGHPSSSDRSHEGCVELTFASTMGGAVEHACGADARAWCHAAYGRQDAHAQAVQARCRIAGIMA